MTPDCGKAQFKDQKSVRNSGLANKSPKFLAGKFQGENESLVAENEVFTLFDDLERASRVGLAYISWGLPIA